MKLTFQPSEPYEWEAFCSARVGYLHALGEVVEGSLLRQDTNHPVFCGCIDWHSSVHGCYALLVTSRLTGEVRWLDVVDEILNAENLRDELACLLQGQLDHELPYGFGWFLKLAQEYELHFQQDRLTSLAAEIARRLECWLFSLSPSEIRERLDDRKYGNLSWPILNVWEWSRWTANHSLTERIKHFTELNLVPSHKEDSLKSDVHEDEFFSTSLQRIRAILAVLPESVSQAWFLTSLRDEEQILPLTHAPFPHSGGLNFSRSWGLWDLYRKTGSKKFQELYMKHIVTHMNLPQFWRDDYRKYGHWVPQFGIYAIALSMENASCL